MSVIVKQMMIFVHMTYIESALYFLMVTVSTKVFIPTIITIYTYMMMLIHCMVHCGALGIQIHAWYNLYTHFNDALSDPAGTHVMNPGPCYHHYKSHYTCLGGIVVNITLLFASWHYSLSVMYTGPLDQMSM